MSTMSWTSSDAEEESTTKIYQQQCDIVRLVAEREAYCFDTERFAEYLVAATCQTAVEEVKLKSCTAADLVRPLPEDLCSIAVTSDESFGCGECPPEWETFKSPSSKEINCNGFSGWPKNSEFNIKDGLEKLEEYVNTWERAQEWVFSVEFLGFESEDCSNYFLYEVEWSQPTNMYPMPQATASVYFALEVSRVVPPDHDREITVSYLFECSNLIHVPGRRNFQEKWLKDIVDAKLRFYKTITL